MQDHLNVYQRTGQPCRRCGRPIRRIVLGARGTHFCSWCQRLPRGSGRRPARGSSGRPGRRRGPAAVAELPLGEGSVGALDAPGATAGRPRLPDVRSCASRRCAARSATSSSSTRSRRHRARRAGRPGGCQRCRQDDAAADRRRRGQPRRGTRRAHGAAARRPAEPGVEPGRGVRRRARLCAPRSARGLARSRPTSASWRRWRRPVPAPSSRRATPDCASGSRPSAATTRPARGGDAVRPGCGRRPGTGPD